MKKTLKAGDMLGPIPVVAASLGQGDEKNIITIAWTGIINSDPPMTYISVRPSRHSHDILVKEREFVINLTTESIAKQVDWCGVKSGRDVDKFRETGFTPLPCDRVKCPMIGESPINLECKVTDIIKLPSHDMFIAEIVAVHVDEELMDEDGRVAYERAGLAAYIHGEYYGIKKTALGRFGYSVMKAKTKKRISKAEHEKRVEKNRARRSEMNK